MNHNSALECLREELNSAVIGFIDLTDKSIVNLSQQLDKTIVIEQKRKEKRSEILIE